MQIIATKYMGFCKGVQAAVDKAVEASKTAKTYTLGNLINNREYLKLLREKYGIEVTENGLPDEGNMVIRAHGVPPGRIKEISETKLNIIDCTCAFVKKIQRIVEAHYLEGCRIIIFGDREHPEVIGLNGHCNNTAIILEDDADFCSFLLSTESGEEIKNKCCMVFQTTFGYKEYEKVVERSKKHEKEFIKTLEIFDTICYTTLDRQKEAEIISSECDIVLVIGDVNSSNCMKLYDIARSKAGKAYLVSKLSDINSVDKYLINKLGVIAAASAPKELVMEVIKKMSETQSSSVMEEASAAQQEETTAVEATEAVETKEATVTIETAEETAEETAAEEVLENAAAEESAGAEVAEEVAGTVEETAVEISEEAVTEESAEAESIQSAEAEVVADLETSAVSPVNQVDLPVPPYAEAAGSVAVKPAVKEKQLTMADVMSSNKSNFVYKEGKRVKAIVINANENGVNVAIGGKKDGFIDKSEANLDGSYNPSDFREGMEIDAVIIENKAKDSTYINLSKKNIDAIKENDRQCEDIIRGGEFSFACDKVVKGGIAGKLGNYTIFVPASQIRIGFVKNLEEYIGKKLRLIALPPKEIVTEDGEVKPQKSGRFIVASQKAILESERREKEEAFWNEMQVGNVVSGRVKRFSSFGAFVNVKGVDCLVHISDISWNKIVDPSRILTINAVYDFIVLKVDRENNKISLGYKQLQKKPYELAAERYPIGSVITGRVERIKDFGAFIALDDGVDGLVHVSQISHDWIRNANEVLKVGDEVSAKVISFEENKITLSIKELLPKPEYHNGGSEDGEAEEGENSGARKRRMPKKPEAKDGRVESQPKKDNNSIVRERRPKPQQESDELREWTSTSASTSLGDIFKGIELNVEEEE